MDGKTPLRAPGARLPLSKISMTWSDGLRSAHVCIRVVSSWRGRATSRGRIRQCICRNDGTKARPAHRAAVYKALLSSEQNTRSCRSSDQL